jgi:acyl-CoA thioester hydrolase
VPEPFRVRYAVRSYELDLRGHLTGSVYVQYADHARWELVQAAGITVESMLKHGVGPVNLETTLRFHNELRAGDEVDVSCSFEWGDGRTFRVVQEFVRADGVLAAEVTSVSGLLDLKARRLVDDPAELSRRLATRPALMGL